MLARAGRDDKAGASNLAHALGGLPLAAEQAAVFLKNRRGVTFDEYAADIPRLIKRRRDAGALGNYPDTVYAAFVKSLETLDQSDAGMTALDVVRLCAFLSPDGVDLALLLIDEDNKILPADFAAAMADTYQREDALSALASLSLLRQEEGPAGTVLIFHRLLLDVTRDWMGADARDLWGSAAVRLVNDAFPYDSDDDPSQWPLCARLMPHIAPLDNYAARVGITGKSLDRLLNQACGYLFGRGDLAGALALAMAVGSVGLARLTRGEDPLGLAASLSNMAGRYLDLHRLNDAETAYREALSLAEPLLEPNDPRLATTLERIPVMWRRSLHVGSNWRIPAG